MEEQFHLLLQRPAREAGAPGGSPRRIPSPCSSAMSRERTKWTKATPWRGHVAAILQLLVSFSVLSGSRLLSAVWTKHAAPLISKQGCCGRQALSPCGPSAPDGSPERLQVGEYRTRPREPRGSSKEPFQQRYQESTEVMGPRYIVNSGDEKYGIWSLIRMIKIPLFLLLFRPNLFTKASCVDG